jgi:hypothetical protein
MGCCCHDAYHGGAQFLTLILEEIRNNLVSIGVNPLTKNENVEEEQAVVEKLYPEIPFVFDRIFLAHSG